jgi:uncharacterized protein (TIGR02594 family)
MKSFVRAAMGVVLLSMTAPTVSLADIDPHDLYNPYNNNQSVVTPKGAKNARASKFAPRAAVTSASSFGSPQWIAVARGYKGTNPTGRKSLWCADFLNLVLQRSGMKGTSSSMAKSFASYGQRLSGPMVGAIAVVSRGSTAGHVGIVTGIDSSGNPILISGNHNNTVAEATYSKGRVIAYVWPTS